METIKVEATGTRLKIGKSVEIEFSKEAGYKYPVADVPADVALRLAKGRNFRVAEKKPARKKTE